MNKIAFMLVLAAGCNEVPFEGLPCPCANGYVCCSDNVCVAEGNACSAQTQQPDQVSDHPCAAVEDRNSDGVVDFNWTYLFDGAARTLHGDGVSLDGRTEDIDTYSYNAANKLLNYQRTENGLAQATYHWDYDALGRVRELDESWPGFQTSNTWSYSGLTARVVSREPGVAEVVATLQEDAFGHPQGGPITLTDGTTIGAYTFIYNADGKLMHEEADFDSGQRVTFDWTYDADGHTTVYRASDRIDMRITYDGSGRKATLIAQVPSHPADAFTFHYCD